MPDLDMPGRLTIERLPDDFAEGADFHYSPDTTPWPGPQNTGRFFGTLSDPDLQPLIDGIRHFEIKGMATYDPKMKPLFAGQLTDADWDGWPLEPELDPHGLSRLVSFATGFVIGASFGLALVWWLRRG
jgi:hypothetical protein